MNSTKSDQAKLQTLLAKKEPSQDQMQEIVELIRNGSYDMPDASFQYAFRCMKNNKNTQKKYINYDELIYSGLQMKVPGGVLKQYLQCFMNGLGKVPYLNKLTAFVNFVLSPDPQNFTDLLKEDVTDFDSRKRLLTIYKNEGRFQDFIRKVNDFLEQNPNDEESWVQLGQAYTENGQYLRAIFCFEQLLVIAPQNNHYVTRLAQLYSTLGGKQNTETAIKYFSYVVAKSPNNYRALWGLNKVLKNEKLEKQQYEELREKTELMLKKLYKQSGIKIKIDKALQ